MDLGVGAAAHRRRVRWERANRHRDVRLTRPWAIASIDFLLGRDPEDDLREPARRHHRRADEEADGELVAVAGIDQVPEEERTADASGCRTNGIEERDAGPQPRGTTPFQASALSLIEPFGEVLRQSWRTRCSGYSARSSSALVMWERPGMF
jgi:hypothetical protein